MVFIFRFVNIVYHIDLFVNIEESLNSWDKAHLVMMYQICGVDSILSIMQVKKLKFNKTNKHLCDQKQECLIEIVHVRSVMSNSL